MYCSVQSSVLHRSPEKLIIHVWASGSNKQQQQYYHYPATEPGHLNNSITLLARHLAFFHFTKIKNTDMSQPLPSNPLIWLVLVSCCLLKVLQSHLAIMVHVHLGHELEDLRLGGVVAKRPQQRAELLRADVPAVVLNITMIQTIINILVLALVLRTFQH